MTDQRAGGVLPTNKLPGNEMVLVLPTKSREGARNSELITCYQVRPCPIEWEAERLPAGIARSLVPPVGGQVYMRLYPIRLLGADAWKLPPGMNEILVTSRSGSLVQGLGMLYAFGRLDVLGKAFDTFDRGRTDDVCSHGHSPARIATSPANRPFEPKFAHERDHQKAALMTALERRVPGSCQEHTCIFQQIHSRLKSLLSLDLVTKVREGLGSGSQTVTVPLKQRRCMVPEALPPTPHTPSAPAMPSRSARSPDSPVRSASADRRCTADPPTTGSGRS